MPILSVYLSEEEKTALLKFCRENGLTRYKGLRTAIQTFLMSLEARKLLISNPMMDIKQLAQKLEREINNEG